MTCNNHQLLFPLASCCIPTVAGWSATPVTATSQPLAVRCDHGAQRGGASLCYIEHHHYTCTTSNPNNAVFTSSPQNIWEKDGTSRSLSFTGALWPVRSIRSSRGRFPAEQNSSRALPHRCVRQLPHAIGEPGCQNCCSAQQVAGDCGVGAQCSTHQQLN